MIDKVRNYIGLFILVFCILSCSSSHPDTKKAIARVEDQFLYLEDISSLVHEHVSAEDSISIIQNYTDKWIKEQLVIEKAKLNLTEEQQNFTDQLQNYKNSLLIYAFEEKLIEQKLDTTISETDIEIFYVYNKENFELEENIVKCKFVKVPLNAPDIEKVYAWINSNKTEDIDFLKDYCIQFAEKCSIDSTEWISFRELNKQLPTAIENPVQFLQTKNIYQKEDSLFKYIFKITDFQLKGNISPKSYVRDNIRAIILNKRRIDLIKKVKKEIFEEAGLKQKFEVFIPTKK